MLLQNIIKTCQADVFGTCIHSDVHIREWYYDSRKLFHVQPGSLFVALHTGDRNGHQYLQEAYIKGVRIFLISELPDIDTYADACFLRVPDTLQALHELASDKRKSFKGAVLGITGSNGKTIVKEWIWQILRNKLKVYRSPGSFNSQLGVALSLLGIDEDADVVAIEAGISQASEMNRLEAIIRPQIGVFTNLGDAHAASFSSDRDKLNEKLQLFRNTQSIVCSMDQEIVYETIKERYNNKELITWSRRNPEATIFLKEQTDRPWGLLLDLIEDGSIPYTLELPFKDLPSVENALTVICVLKKFGLLSPDMLLPFRNLEPITMRLEQKEGIQGSMLLLDMYNSDLRALEMALDHLLQLFPERKKTVILSDMQQKSLSAQEWCRQIDNLLVSRGIHRLIGVGSDWMQFGESLKTEHVLFATTEELLKNLDQISFQRDAVLIKGSRSAAFERIGVRLQKQAHQTRLEVNLNAMEHNLKVYRSFLKLNQGLMVMVKALAYGSGSARVASMLQRNGVEYLAVAYADEGIALREEGITLPIMVMSPVQGAFPAMLEYGLEPELYSIETLKSFAHAARSAGVGSTPIHLEFDTGMHRLGFDVTDINEIDVLLHNYPELSLQSVFTHLSASEDTSSDIFSDEQFKRFASIKKEFQRVGRDVPLYHISNSSGIHRFNHTSEDMVRLGIGLYGIDPSNLITDRLQPALSFKSYIVQTRMVAAGEGIGYGMKSVADVPRTIGVVAVGYADGYPRSLGLGTGWMQICGKRAQTVGNICMDMCMVDLSNIPEAKAGTEVEIWGSDPGVQEVASWCKTIPYELLTSISERVKRVYLQE